MNMLKKIVSTVSLLIVVIGLSACGGSKVSDEEAEAYKQEASVIIMDVMAHNYEDILTNLNDEMKEDLTEETLKEIEPILKKSGDFKKIGKQTVLFKNDNYTTVSEVTYSKEKRIFSISFNEQEEISSLVVK
ncbi:DUF3887 domain-containing protein [Vagococcus intermedius]|uniref:DUF3887 domain-containing protein n=1 Tax=Vagococcus intermedius TaxID=2991418 RepID=A0AAF0CW62_9ENTE|nr:DUF3887 domain-containing protein [Vagococcus intermedius]WEG73991.1 DUF3887 domain-containing protein [Vagococcus intermedius]WEG76071.1 DUF3887 domain-containing protein [Vagococcus intermedius]